MRFRTIAFASMLMLVVGIGSLTVLAAALTINRAARHEVVDGLVRSERVFESLHSYRAASFRAQAQVLASEPRLKALVATEDVTHDTVMGVAHELRQALRAELLVVTDAHGTVLADDADASASGLDLSRNPQLQQALARGESSGIWLSGGKAFQVQAHRIELDGAPLGAVVVGYVEDDLVAQRVFEQTGSVVAVVLDGKVLAASTAEGEGAVDRAALVAALAPVLVGKGGPAEVKLDGRSYLASSAPLPGYSGPDSLRYAVLRSLDQALAPGRRLTRALLFLLALAATAAGLLAAYISRLLSRPLDTLVAWMARVGKEGNLAPAELSHGALEVRELAAALERMVAELHESRKGSTERDRLAKEMEIAIHLQTAILPRELKVEGLQVAARMVPAHEVGGDYYDVLPVAEGAFIGIGDVAGHGLTAGVVMMMLQNVTAALVRTHPDASPRELVCRLNEVVYENVRKRMRRNEHATYSLLRYHLDGRLVYAGAHEELILCRADTGRSERLPVHGTWVGAMKNVERFTEDATVQLRPGDVVMLYSDGLTEAMNAEGQQFGVERLCAELERLHRHTPDEICDSLLQLAKAWGVRQADDITLVALRFQPGAASQQAA